MKISSAGDLGDSVIALSIIAQIPDGPHDLILRKSTVTKMRTDESVATWHRLVQPLFESQPYIRECRIAKEGEHADWSSEGFRGSGLHSKTSSLFNAHLSHLIATRGIGKGLTSKDPWLKVDPSEKTKGRVVIARSGRYRNGNFQWQKVVDFYGDRLVFIGLPHEWAEFSGQYGMVEHLPTKDLLEVAQYIAGSLLFIGNQSSPMTVCEGLKHRSIQETSTNPSDCIYKRDNAQYSFDGRMILPGFEGQEDLAVQSPHIQNSNISTIFTPPKGWQHPKIGPCTNFKQAVSILKALPTYREVPEAVIKQEIIDYNVERVPDFFISKNAFGSARRAMQEAGYDL